MKLKLNKDNFIFSINDNSKSDEEYCKISLSFKSGLLNVNIQNEELLTLLEIKRIYDCLQALLNNQLDEGGTLKFNKKDLEIEIHPEYNVKNESAVLFVAPGFGIIPMYIVFKINLYNIIDGKKEYTNNYLTIKLKQKDIELLKQYLQKYI